MQKDLRNTEKQYILQRQLQCIFHYLANIVFKAVQEDLKGVFDGYRKTFCQSSKSLHERFLKLRLLIVNHKRNE